MIRRISIVALLVLAASGQTTNRFAWDSANRAHSTRDYVPLADYTTNNLRLWLPFIIAPTNSTTFDAGDCSPWRRSIGQTDAAARPVWTNGAMLFDGVNDYLIGPVSAPTNELTICTWYKRDTGTAGRPFTIADGPASNYVFMFEGAFTGAITNELVGIGQAINSTTRLYWAATTAQGNQALTGGWHFLSLVMSATSNEIWIDSTNRAIEAIAGLSTTGVVVMSSVTNAWLGALPLGTARVFSAHSQDGVMIYQRKLTGKEHTNLYRTTRPR